MQPGDVWHLGPYSEKGCVSAVIIKVGHMRVDLLLQAGDSGQVYLQDRTKSHMSSKISDWHEAKECPGE